MPDRAAVEAALRRIGTTPDATIDLAEAALLLAAWDRPDLALDPYRRHLQDLAAAVTAAAAEAGNFAARLAALNRQLVEEFGYQGDRATYDDPRNADLAQVIDRRRGLPIALGILYIHAGRAQGWTMEGVNFPGHFLVRLDTAGERALIDPFDGGKRLDAVQVRALLQRMTGDDAPRPEHYQAASNRDVLIRLRNNLKTRAITANDAVRAEAVVQTMLMISPDHAASWRDLSLVCAHQGKMKEALAACEKLLALARDPVLRREAEVMRREIRARLN